VRFAPVLRGYHDISIAEKYNCPRGALPLKKLCGCN
jgi:hypothetical protein